MPVKVGNKVLRSLGLEPEADEALRLLAKRVNIPAAQLLREGLDLIFDKYGEDVWSHKTATNPTRRVVTRVRKAARPAKSK